jgi:hypothetical protein
MQHDMYQHHTNACEFDKAYLALSAALAPLVRSMPLHTAAVDRPLQQSVSPGLEEGTGGDQVNRQAIR